MAMWPRDFPFLVPPTQPAYTAYVNAMYEAGFTGEQLGYPDDILTIIAYVIWADQHTGQDRDTNKIVVVADVYDSRPLWFLETMITFREPEKAAIAQDLHEAIGADDQHNRAYDLAEQLYSSPASVTFTTPEFLRGDGIHNDDGMPVVVKGLTRTLDVHINKSGSPLVYTQASNSAPHEVIPVWLFS